MRRDGWDTAFDAQNDLREALQKEMGRNYLRFFTESRLRIEDRMKSGEITPSKAMRETKQLTDAAVQMVELGDPIWVNADVVDLVDAAAKSFAPEPISREDIFIPAGFAYLQKPLTVIDKHGLAVSYRAVSWCPMNAVLEEGLPSKEGIGFTLWSHKDDAFELDGEKEWAKKLPTEMGKLVLAHVWALPFDYLPEDMLEDDQSLPYLRQLQVLWRLMRQEIVVPGRQQVSRPTWRRKSNWRQIKHVTILTLRRASTKRYGDGPAEDVPWSHRWLVRGHCRSQPYKNADGSIRYEQIWIAPYVKGPEDLPFVPKVRAVEFIR